MSSKKESPRKLYHHEYHMKNREKRNARKRELRLQNIAETRKHEREKKSRKLHPMLIEQKKKYRQKRKMKKLLLEYSQLSHEILTVINSPVTNPS